MVNLMVHEGIQPFATELNFKAVQARIVAQTEGQTRPPILLKIFKAAVLKCPTRGSTVAIAATVHFAGRAERH